MKQLINCKTIAKFLAIVLFLTAIFAVIACINVDTVFANSLYSANYQQVEDTELDSLTRRTEKSSTNAQITVFVHGFGGSASHWTNNSTDYMFAGWYKESECLNKWNFEMDGRLITYANELNINGTLNIMINKI